MARKLKSVSKLKAEAQKVFNKYIRYRDTNGWIDACQCISCGKTLIPGKDKIDAGHWFSVRYSSIRYDERNVNAQCFTCNNFLGGNGAAYRIGLINKIGEKQVRDLENIYLNPVKWDRFELMELIEEYKYKLNELIK